jgi:hypothetical protein
MKAIALFIFLCLSGCNYIEDMADDAAENAIGDCPTQEQVERIILDAIDDAFEHYRYEMKEDMKEVLEEVING